MSGYQTITVVGRLGQDPRFNVFDDGGSICNISVATSEQWKDKETGEKKEWTEWHRCVLRNKMAELAEQYLNKGDQDLLVGKNRTRQWEDSGGVKHYTTEVQVREMKFMGKANADNSNAKADAQKEQTGPADTSADEPTKDDDDGLPF